LTRSRSCAASDEASCAERGQANLEHAIQLVRHT
jgi:hypothetical protein